MSNDPRAIKEKNTTPVAIAPAMASLKKINRKVKMRYKQWLSTHKLRKWLPKIPEVISVEEEKEYMFQEQQEAEEAEAESWEKKQKEERQQQLQEKYQQLKKD